MFLVCLTNVSSFLSCLAENAIRFGSWFVRSFIFSSCFADNVLPSLPCFVDSVLCPPHPPPLSPSLSLSLGIVFSFLLADYFRFTDIPETLRVAYIPTVDFCPKLTHTGGRCRKTVLGVCATTPNHYAPVTSPRQHPTVNHPAAARAWSLDVNVQSPRTRSPANSKHWFTTPESDARSVGHRRTTESRPGVTKADNAIRSAGQVKDGRGAPSEGRGGHWGRCTRLRRRRE